MKLEVINDVTIEVSDRGNTVTFDCSAIKKSKLAEPDKDLFNEINQYLASLDNTRQYEIFKVYEDIAEIQTTSSLNFTFQQQDLTDLVARLYRLIDIDKLALYIPRYVKVQYPPNLMTRGSKEETESHLNKNINYTLEDYSGLVVLVIALRLMVPIWGAYLTIYKNAVNTRFKDFTAFKLLSKSELFHSPYIDRIRIYINEWRGTATNRRELSDDGAVLDGISSEGLPEYLLASLLIRKVAITNVNATSQTDSIISNVFGYLRRKNEEAIRQFKTNPKYDDNAVEDETGDTVSKLEQYKIATKLTHGDIAFIRQYVGSPFELIRELDPTIDATLLNQCLETNMVRNTIIQKHTLLLLQWTLSPIIPPLAMYELNRDEVLILLSVAQALMIHWQMYELAIIIASTVDYTLINIGSMTRDYIEEDLLYKLNEIYPYQRITKGVQTKTNVAYNDIFKLKNELIPLSFEFIIPEVLRELSQKQGNTMQCPIYIINLFAALLIQVDNLRG